MYAKVTARQVLFEHAKAGATILTATGRLARALQLDYAAWQVSLGVTAWETPDILPFQGWLSRCGMEFSLLRNGDATITSGTLETAQEEILWEDALRAETANSRAISVEALAQLMMRAHDVEQQWLLAVESDAGSTDDTVLYIAVRDRVLAACRENGYQLDSMQWSTCRQLLSDGSLKLPENVVLAGFERRYPTAMRKILDQAVRRGIAVLRFDAETMPVQSCVMRFPTREDEILAAAAWARRLLEQGEERIAVVFPRLQEYRHRIERIFADTLLPFSSAFGHSADDTVFELSLGVRLAQEPIVNAALHALDLLKPTAGADTVSRILRSAFFSASEEFSWSRACVDAGLRRENLDEDSWSSFRNRLSKSVFAETTDPLQRFLVAHDYPAERKLPSAWADYLDEVLAAIGWPGDRVLDSRAYQARMRFKEQLSAMAGFDSLLGGMSASEAVARLRRLTAATVFQPRSRNAPVQIMGVFEAIGQEFRHVRLCDMTEDSWPPAARPAAFIPIAIQKQAGVSDAVAELHVADMERVTAALLSCSPNLIVSAAEMEGDRELLPSPLVSSLPRQEADNVAETPAAWLRGSTPVVMERFEDATAPELARGTSVRGGSGLFTMQARCPFQAFARLRLSAAPLAMPEHGVRPLDRGILAHNALQNLWQTLQHSGDLRRDDLSDVIRRAVEDTFSEPGILKSGRLPAQMVRAEKECIQRLLVESIAVEAARPPFVIEALEAPHTTEIAGLTVSLRIDRIDRLADETLAVIDYKISKKSVGDWLSERPLEPQLPLYVMSWRERVSAMAFATVKRANCGFIGIAATPAVFPQLGDVADLIDERGAPFTWTGLVERWTAVLEALAESFRSGDARVDPRDGSNTCSTCDLQPLCRIDEYLSQSASTPETDHD